MKKLLLCVLMFGQIRAMDQQTTSKDPQFYFHVPTLHTIAAKAVNPEDINEKTITRATVRDEAALINKATGYDIFKKDNPDLLAYLFQKEKFILDLNSFETFVTLAIDNNSYKIVEFLFAHAKNVPQVVLNEFLIKARSSTIANIYGFLIDKAILQAANLGIDRGSFFSRWNDLPLHRAVITNNEKEVETFIAQQKDAKTAINQADNQGKTPLLLALKYGASDSIAEKLIAAGADVTTKDQFDNTALHYTSLNGYANTAKLLIERKANVNAKNDFNRTPLHWASERGHINIVELLIKNMEAQQTMYAGVNAQNDNDETPLHIASENGHTKIVDLLITNNATVNARDSIGHSPLHVASRNGYTDIVKLLIDKDAYVDAKDKEGQTPLHYACKHGHIKVVQLLVENGANVKAPDKKNVTPLSIASEEGHTDIVKLLIEKGADVNAKGGKVDYTPLHTASENRHTEIVKLLLANGADINAKNYFGRTPLQQMRLLNECKFVAPDFRKKYTDIINLLEQHEAK